MEKREIFRSIIESNNRHPNKFSDSLPNGYSEFYIEEKECIDDFRVFVKFEENTIKDALFSGSGCAVSTASLNILCNMLIDMKIEDAEKLLLNYSNLILKGIKFEGMGDLEAFSGIHKQLNRISCGLYASKLLKGVIDGRI